MFILDTDYIGIIQRQTEPEFSRLGARMAEHEEMHFYFTIVSFQEQFLGWNTYINRAKKVEGVVKGYSQLQQIVADFNAAQVLPFDDAAASAFVALRKSKVRVGTMDLRIAAIALSRKMTVLTRNLGDFAQVPGVNGQDWTK